MAEERPVEDVHRDAGPENPYDVQIGQVVRLLHELIALSNCFLERQHPSSIQQKLIQRHLDHALLKPLPSRLSL